jgi:hypothetical protein
LRYKEDESMNKLFFVAFIVSVLVISSTITSASATSGWMKSNNPPSVRHTASNPGSTKICGYHKCAPFEDMRKSLEEIVKQNQILHVLKQTQTKIYPTS